MSTTGCPGNISPEVGPGKIVTSHQSRISLFGTVSRGVCRYRGLTRPMAQLGMTIHWLLVGGSHSWIALLCVYAPSKPPPFPDRQLPLKTNL